MIIICIWVRVKYWPFLKKTFSCSDVPAPFTRTIPFLICTMSPLPGCQSVPGKLNDVESHQNESLAMQVVRVAGVSKGLRCVSAEMPRSGFTQFS